MKRFFKDYKEMCVKPQLQWIKKHWKGYTLMCIGAFAIRVLVTKVMGKIQEKNFEKMYAQEEKNES